MKKRGIIPLYHRIYIHLFKNISSGVLSVGKTIPTETSLMERFEASRTTVRRALRNLVEEGIITRRAGKGSFVKKSITKSKIKLQGSFQDIMDIAKNTKVDVLRFEYVEGPSDILNQLMIKGNSRVLRVDRARYSNDIPFLYSINYLPEDVGRFLSIKDLEEEPLGELLRTKCHLVLGKAIQTFSATVADDLMADILKVPIGFPLMQINRVTSSTKDRPINLFLGYFRSDVYEFTAVFPLKT